MIKQNQMNQILEKEKNFAKFQIFFAKLRTRTKLRTRSGSEEMNGSRKINNDFIPISWHILCFLRLQDYEQ